ncbi:MAG TPA: bile acid:sodium symporter family protein [Sphingobium sp.]|uniref:bile acid:sodium symporter family protein n=1 Tax=Sphingobium sp. TaxID=1912891 RepID=UPI002ED1FD22
MSALRTLLARLDPYMLLLLSMVGLGIVLPARGEAAEWAETAVHGAVALLFFLYGARLAPAAIWAGIAHWRLQSLVFASTFILFPIIGLGAYWLARPWLPPDIALGLLFLTLLPSTVQSSIAFTGIARGNVPAALCSASLSNLLGVAITPLLVAVLFPKASGGGISAHAFIDIAAQLLLPFFAGQIARPFIGGWLLRHKQLTSMVDRGSILLVVYAAFSAGMVAGIWSQLDVADLAGVLVAASIILAIVIVATTFASRALGFPIEDEIAIVFCGSKKSMASGIPMATILFPGHGVGMIVLPLMIFHQVQLFVCAVLARRYAARDVDVRGRQDSAAVVSG